MPDPTLTWGRRRLLGERQGERRGHGGLRRRGGAGNPRAPGQHGASFQDTTRGGAPTGRPGRGSVARARSSPSSDGDCKRSGGGLAAAPSASLWLAPHQTASRRPAVAAGCESVTIGARPLPPPPRARGTTPGDGHIRTAHLFVRRRGSARLWCGRVHHPPLGDCWLPRRGYVRTDLARPVGHTAPLVGQQGRNGRTGRSEPEPSSSEQAFNYRRGH